MFADSFDESFQCDSTNFAEPLVGCESPAPLCSIGGPDIQLDLHSSCENPNTEGPYNEFTAQRFFVNVESAGRIRLSFSHPEQSGGYIGDERGFMVVRKCGGGCSHDEVKSTKFFDQSEPGFSATRNLPVASGVHEIVTARPYVEPGHTRLTVNCVEAS